MNDQCDAADEASALLRRAGVPDRPLTKGGGVANEVWLAPSCVIRLNEGRLRHALLHETRMLALLPAAVPHPTVVAYGERAGGGEYLILERLPGRTLDEAWPELSTGERQHVVQDVARMTRRLHALPISREMENPWLKRALRDGIYADAYHALPLIYHELVSSASALHEPDGRALLEEVEAFIAARMAAFGREANVLVHADLHFRNIMVDGCRVSGIIDFEGSRPAPADVELDTLLRFQRSGTEFGSARTNDYADVTRWFREAYPALFAHPRLVERLEVYEAMWHLVQLHHWTPGAHMADPKVALHDLLAGRFAGRVEAFIS